MQLETKGKSKITAEEVIAARKLKAANPEMSMQAIKDELGLKIHTIMVGRAIRGITHSHLDMCGLPVRPFEHTDAIQCRLQRKEERKATRAAKKAAAVPSADLYVVAKNKKGGFDFTAEQIAEAKRLAAAKTSPNEIAAKFKVSKSTIVRLLAKN